MRKLWLFLVMSMAAVALIACSDDTSNSGDAASSEGGDGPPDEVTEWVFQPAFDSGDAGWDNGVVPWIEAVEEATEGTVKVSCCLLVPL